jgi:hypothetical protein
MNSTGNVCHMSESSSGGFYLVVYFYIWLADDFLVLCKSVGDVATKRGIT